jgi:transcriptional regulator GlxA family with amidase domain
VERETMSDVRHWKVGILLFDEVEVLDFAGPFEVFSVTAYSETDLKPFIVDTISETGNLIVARNGLKVQPDYGFENAPYYDILVIPGGPGARNQQINNQAVIEWIRKRSAEVQLMTSVCTGALLLAKAGLLQGKRATTHWASYDRLENEFPEVIVKRNIKYVDEGDIITSGGISAGINMAFHVVRRLLSPEIAQITARRMEYDIDSVTVSC